MLILMPILAILLLLFTVMLGISLFIKLVSEEPLPKSVIYAHGILASCGLVLMLGFLYTQALSFGLSTQSTLVLGALLLLMAVATGWSLLKVKRSRKLIRNFLTVIHPLLAIIALIMLIVTVLP